MHRFIADLPYRKSADGKLGKYIVLQFNVDTNKKTGKLAGVRVTAGTITLADPREYDTNNNIKVHHTKLYNFKNMETQEDLNITSAQAGEEVMLTTVIECISELEKRAGNFKKS